MYTNAGQKVNGMVYAGVFNLTIFNVIPGFKFSDNILRVKHVTDINFIFINEIM